MMEIEKDPQTFQYNSLYPIIRQFKYPYGCPIISAMWYNDQKPFSDNDIAVVIGDEMLLFQRGMSHGENAEVLRFVI